MRALGRDPPALALPEPEPLTVGAARPGAARGSRPARPPRPAAGRAEALLPARRYTDLPGAAVLVRHARRALRRGAGSAAAAVGRAAGRRSAPPTRLLCGDARRLRSPSSFESFRFLSSVLTEKGRKGLPARPAEAVTPGLCTPRDRAAFRLPALAAELPPPSHASSAPGVCTRGPRTPRAWGRCGIRGSCDCPEAPCCPARKRALGGSRAARPIRR